MSKLKMKYFVLKPHGSDIHAMASRAAMEEYADQIDKDDPQLADSLRSWVDVAFKESPGPLPEPPMEKKLEMMTEGRDEYAAIAERLKQQLDQLTDELRLQSDATMAACKEGTDYRAALTQIYSIADRLDLDPTERMKEILCISREALVKR